MDLRKFIKLERITIPDEHPEIYNLEEDANNRVTNLNDNMTEDGRIYDEPIPIKEYFTPEGQLI